MIAKDKKHNKPSFPLVVACFSKDGKVKKIVKRLPWSKELLEEEIIKHFFNILRKKRNFKQPIKNKENDLDFRVEEVLCDKKVIWIVELVEIFDKEWQLQDVRRNEYLKELQTPYNNIQKYDKFLIIINDQYQNPSFPKICSRKWKKLINQMKEIISSTPEKMKKVPNNIIKKININKFYDFTVVKNPPVSLPQLKFFAGYISSDISDRNLFIKTIKKKIEKNYTIDSSQKIMLVSYSTQKIYSLNSELKKEIEKINNTFDEIWFFYPFIEADRGVIEQIV